MPHSCCCRSPGSSIGRTSGWCAVREQLADDGLLRRYVEDELEGSEGAFLACSFWLAECLARQDRRQEARRVFDRASSTANDVGLFSEQFDTGRDEMLGNLSHIAAAVALARAEGD